MVKGGSPEKYSARPGLLEERGNLPVHAERARTPPATHCPSPPSPSPSEAVGGRTGHRCRTKRSHGRHKNPSGQNPCSFIIHRLCRLIIWRLEFGDPGSAALRISFPPASRNPVPDRTGLGIKPSGARGMRDRTNGRRSAFFRCRHRVSRSGSIQTVGRTGFDPLPPDPLLFQDDDCRPGF